MISTAFFEETSNRRIIEKEDKYTVIEYQKDLSTNADSAIRDYYAAKMNTRRRQLAVVLDPDNGVIIQSGAMQWMASDVQVATNVKSAGDLLKKAMASKVTNESAIKPRYYSKSGGILVLEPTYKHLLIEPVHEWGGLVMDDGMFLACDDTVDVNVTSVGSMSGAVLGGKGLFNTMLTGKGYAVMESSVPREEIVEITIEDDVLKVDGPMVIAWSKSLRFTVQKTTKTLVGSAASGEGFVNVYEGTGKVLMAPIA